MTICSTCQGVMGQANRRMQDPEYLAEINSHLAEEGLEYQGTAVVKHLLWILIEDYGLDKLLPHVTRPLGDLRIAPFYGCYIVRPTEALGIEEHPERQTSLETLIQTLGATVIDFEGKTRCCGFPILTINEKNSMAMVGKHTSEAKDLGADAMVTPCPLCHLNLDGFQPKAAKQAQRGIGLPILCRYSPSMNPAKDIRFGVTQRYGARNSANGSVVRRNSLSTGSSGILGVCSLGRQN